MSGTFPTTPGPYNVLIKSVAASYVSVSHSMKRQTRSRGPQRWQAQLSWKNLTKALFMPIWAFSLKQRGQVDNFQITLTGYTQPQGSWAGTPRVNGASQSGFSLVLDGFTPSQTGVVKAGDFFKFTGFPKVYIATADANSDGGGNATISIYPAMMDVPADNDIIVHTNVPFTMAFSSDIHEAPAQLPHLLDFDVQLVEDV